VLHVFGIDFRLLDCWKICRQKGHKWYPTSLNPLRFDNSSLSNPFYDAVIGPLGSTSYDMWELFPAVFWSLYKQSLYSDAWCLYIRYNAPLKPTSISIIGTYMIHEYPLQTAVPDAVTAQPLRTMGFGPLARTAGTARGLVKMWVRTVTLWIELP
jgi:hypothetical protein